MEKYGADGDVMEISLTTVKVQNFDKTITTIPTYSFITDSFNTAGTVTLGKIISPTGQSLLDESAHSVRPLAEERHPELARY